VYYVEKEYNNLLSDFHACEFVGNRSGGGFRECSRSDF
jgi:hypothetical protein